MLDGLCHMRSQWQHKVKVCAPEVMCPVLSFPVHAMANCLYLIAVMDQFKNNEQILTPERCEMIWVIEHAWQELTSWGKKTFSSRNTCRISSSFSRGTLNTMLNAPRIPRSFITPASLDVPMIISFFPLGGGFSKSSSTSCRSVFEKRGPIGTYSTIRSMLSRMTREACDCSTWGPVTTVYWNDA